MNSHWIKFLLITSSVLCLISLVALGWLAFQATELQDDAAVPAFPFKKLPPKKHVGSTSHSSLHKSSAQDSETQSVDDDLLEKLAALEQSKTVVTGELLLSFRDPQALAAFLARAGKLGIQVLYQDPRLNSARIRYQDRHQLAMELRDHADQYENIGPNHLVWVPGIPDNIKDTDNAGGRVPFESSGLKMIRADQMDRSRWGAGVKVAVLDTGVTDHEDLVGIKITHLDFVQDGKPYDGHGTAMTGLIAGNDSENGGVSPKSEILDYRVANAEGVGNVATLAEAIIKAVDDGARVLNISLGTTAESRMLARAVEYAIAKNVVVVAAAGNEQASQLAYPAAYEGVISVAAIDANGRQAYFSNSGEGLFIAAPGVGIISPYNDNKTVIGSGTSQAAAIVSGAVSALLSRNYQASNIRQILTQYAHPSTLPANQVGVGVLRLPGS
jgi:thermitase